MLTIATMSKAKEGKLTKHFFKETNKSFAINPKLTPFLNQLQGNEMAIISLVLQTNIIILY